MHNFEGNPYSQDSLLRAVTRVLHNEPE